MTDRSSSVDVVVVGAGFAGLYALHRLRAARPVASRASKVAADVGGTWCWNRYPGARCDIESMDYSYSFSPELEQEWTWTERYATQPEILRYVEPRRRPLRPAPRHPVRHPGRRRPTWDEDARRWTVDDRPRRPGVGALLRHGDRLPVGREAARDRRPRHASPGEILHTGRWPHEGVDFSGRRVGVIGTGSSGIQSIPLIAEAGRAPHRVPAHAELHACRPGTRRSIRRRSQARKARYPEHREALGASRRAGVVVPTPDDLGARASTTEARERAVRRERWDSGTLFGILGAFNDLLLDRDANDTAAEFVRDRIREHRRRPRGGRAAVAHGTYPFGTKRLCLDTDYYATYNRENVTLVDLRATPIARSARRRAHRPTSLHELDVLVFATGFDAMTGPLLGPDITGARRRARSARRGRTGRAPTSASPSPGSRTCSPSPDRAARRCSST